jgi:hypothetical protein
MIMGIGQTQPVITACPHCSYLWEGKCIVCAEGDPHPACKGCVDGQLAKTPWYKSDMFVAIVAGVAISVVSTIIVTRIERRLSKKR